MSTFDALVSELTRDARRVQPKDALQFCANWFQSRLEEQRARARDILQQNANILSHDVPSDLYVDTPMSTYSSPMKPPAALSPFLKSSPIPRVTVRDIMAPGPFGTLNVPGNALISDTHQQPPTLRIDREQPPTSPLSTGAPFTFGETTPVAASAPNPGDYLHPPTAAIFARRTSVSAESINVDSTPDDPTPVYPKTPDQLRRIKSAIKANLLFRDLDEEQETGVLNAFQERKVDADEVVIRQGDDGEYFYVVESGLLHCFIRPEPLPPAWNHDAPSVRRPRPDVFVQPGFHPEFGKKVAECKPGNSFGELALMYGHPRAATVLAIESSTLWCLDRITFRTIVLKAAHRRRTMYERFLSGVTLLSSLEPQERSKIADALVSKTYVDGEAVVRQGEMGDTFFFIEEGEAVVTKLQEGDDSEMREIIVGHLTKGDYFGELSLLHLAPRAATVSAIYRTDTTTPKLKVAALDAQAFTRLLGPLREIMERRAGERYGGPRR
ncbi:hypothetical protein AX16_000023 [Volvariella volvacea WC 439]|nr:hypothetical protein AX16_000023 [Volvariella volvacea WC 439]